MNNSTDSALSFLLGALLSLVFTGLVVSGCRPGREELERKAVDAGRAAYYLDTNYVWQNCTTCEAMVKAIELANRLEEEGCKWADAIIAAYYAGYEAAAKENKP